jgi:hypothetical protein
MRLAGQGQLKPGRRGYRESVGACGSLCPESGRWLGTSFLRPRKRRPKSRRPTEPARAGSMRWTSGRRREDCHQPPPRLGFARHRPSQRPPMHREHSGIYRPRCALRSIVRRNERECIASIQVSTAPAGPCAASSVATSANASRAFRYLPLLLGLARHRPSQRARMHREHSGIYRSCWALRSIVRRNERDRIASIPVSTAPVGLCAASSVAMSASREHRYRPVSIHAAT